jgi:hypothetical protein
MIVPYLAEYSMKTDKSFPELIPSVPETAGINVQNSITSA